MCLSVKRAREKRERKKSYTWKLSDSRLYPEYRGLQLFLSVDKKKARKHPKVSKLEADASRRSFSVAIVCIHLGKFDRAFLSFLSGCLQSDSRHIDLFLWSVF